MADIFISYAREDRETAKTLAQALADRGWSVWWDRHVPSGRRFHEVIDRELAAARCVIALWSKAALDSQWVREEAQAGLDRDILVPAKIEAVPLPIGFRSIQTADLVGWKRDQAHLGFAQLITDISVALGNAPPKEQVVEPGAKPEKPVERGAEPEANKPVKLRDLPAGTFQKLTRSSLLLVGLLLSLGVVAALIVVPSRDAPPALPGPAPGTASADVRWQSNVFPPPNGGPNGGQVVFAIMPDGNPECASYNARDCLWDQTIDQIDFTRLRPLVCGAGHRAVWGITGFESPNHWCNVALRFAR